MALLDRLRSRLAVRFTVIGLVQLAVIAAGFVMFGRLVRTEMLARWEREEAFAETLAPNLTDPPALLAQLEEARSELDVFVSVVDPWGERVASTAPPELPPCRRGPPRHHRPGKRGHREDGRPDHPHPGARPPRPDGKRFVPCHVTRVRFPDGELGRVEFRPTEAVRPPSPLGLPVLAFILMVVGVASWLVARSIAKPLERMSAAASALGSGDLGARTGVDRPDEIGAVATSFDEMADRVRDLLQAERELVASVSHELRTPLARIRVALDIASEGDAELARESLADIADDVDELERLVSDLLVAARLEGAPVDGVPTVRREPLAVADLVEGLATRFAARHPGRRLEIEVEATTLDGDPALLRRLVDNLLDNAVKYADEDPVELAVRPHGDEVEIAVVDRGIGIDEADHERIFEPFYRVDRSRTRSTGGHGLGLALVRRIARAHGGRVTVESALGEGTTMRVRLPLGSEVA